MLETRNHSLLPSSLNLSTLIPILLLLLVIQSKPTTADDGQWHTQAITTWSYTPSLTWYYDPDSTTIVTITSLVPCPVTSYTTIYQCETCHDPQPGPDPGPEPGPAPVPVPVGPCGVEGGGFTCAIDVFTYTETESPWQVVLTPVPYYAGETIEGTRYGTSELIPAESCCSSTFPPYVQSTGGGLAYANSEGRQVMGGAGRVGFGSERFWLGVAAVFVGVTVGGMIVL